MKPSKKYKSIIINIFAISICLIIFVSSIIKKEYDIIIYAIYILLAYGIYEIIDSKLIKPLRNKAKILKDSKSLNLLLA